jgi:TolB-like protein
MINRITLLLFIGLVFAQDVTIAVLDFEGDGVSQSETRTLTNRLRDEIFNTGIYIVLERGKMDEVLKEQGFQQTGCVTSECAVEVGNMLGVQQMIGGSIGKVGNIYTVSARVIDVQTGKVLKSANYDHKGDIGQLLIKGMKAVVQQLITGIPSNNQVEISHKKDIEKQSKVDSSRFALPDNEFQSLRVMLKQAMLQDSIEAELVAKGEVMKHGQNYLVSIDNIFLDESDFRKYKTGFFSSPSIYIRVYKNFNHGQDQWDNSKNLLFDTQVSKRGLRGINEHKTLKFNKDYVYEIAIIDGGLEFLTDKKYWITSEKGDWVFRKGKVQFGKNSYIELSQVLK